MNNLQKNSSASSFSAAVGNATKNYMKENMGGGSPGGNNQDADRIPSSTYWSSQKPIEETLEAGEKGHPVSKDIAKVDEAIKNQGNSMSKLAGLKKLNALKDIRIAKYKEAGAGKAIKNYLKNPAGGKGLKGGIEQTGRAMSNMSLPAGVAGAGLILGHNPDLKATAAMTAILPAFFSRNVRSRYNKSLGEGNKGMGVLTDVAGGSTKDIMVKGLTGAGAAALDVGVKEGPETWKDFKDSIEAVKQTTGNVEGITKDVKGVTGDIASTKNEAGDTVGVAAAKDTMATTNDMKDTAAQVKNTSGRLDQTLDNLDKITGPVSQGMESASNLADKVSNVMDKFPTLDEVGKVFGERTAQTANFLNKHKLPIGAGAVGLGAIFVYAKWKKAQEEKERLEEERKARQLQNAAYSRLARMG